MTGSLHVGLAALGAALGVGLIGMKASDAVGRNPGAATQILGLANAEHIKAELARTEAQRQEVMMQANTQANALIEQARVAAARVREQQTRKAIAAAEQITIKAREAADREHDRMLAELKREVGRLVVLA